MSYCHMFYGVDLDRLRAIPGSNDMALYEAIIADEENSLGDDEQDALKRILAGNIKNEPHTEHLYGYALKAICNHIGEMVGEEVAAIRDHPYSSKLVANGSPIDIPVNQSDFPEIGYLDRSELEAEHRLATTTAPKAKRTLLGFLLRKATGGAVGREMDADDVAEDMEMYAETLQQCINKNCSLVSFRH
jgi:hypothetical protein